MRERERERERRGEREREREMDLLYRPLARYCIGKGEGKGEGTYNLSVVDKKHLHFWNSSERERERTDR